MFEFFQLLREALAPYNLPLTALLAAVAGYWLLVVLGFMDFEIPIANGAEGTEHGVHGSGAWLTAGRILGFSKVPIVVWGSFFVLFLWGVSLAANANFNPSRTVPKAITLLAPNILIALALTKLATTPVARLYAAMADADTEAEDVLGRIGTVVTPEADATYGQLEVLSRGAPLLLNVRTFPSADPLPKGASAKVVEADPSGAFYRIIPETDP